MNWLELLSQYMYEPTCTYMYTYMYIKYMYMYVHMYPGTYYVL